LNSPSFETPLIEIADITLAVMLVYALLSWLKDARARLALVGVALVGVGYLVALQAGLILTSRLLQTVFLVSVVMLVLVSQEGLRRVFERLASLVLRRSATAPTTAVEILVKVAYELTKDRRGALIVIPGRDPIDRHIQGGLPLDGVMSEALLHSLFDPNSPGHDGAVVIERDRVSRFAVPLPLSSEIRELGTRGTRHAAALGLSERCDAACIVVSEERAAVALAYQGHLEPMGSAAQLEMRLRELSGASAGAPARPGGTRRLLWVHGSQLAIAFAVGLVLWGLAVPGSQRARRQLSVPVQVDNLPAGFELEAVSPASLDVTVDGLRRDLFFLQPGALSVRVDAFLVRLGRRTFGVTPQSVGHPPDVEVSAVSPGSVVLTVRKPTGPEPEGQEGEPSP
jgi:DNA integrity scanning protein DisA with diadenylate cyclase activity